MAKHLIGFGLFLSIVTFFALAFAFFTVTPIPVLLAVDAPADPPMRWNYCDRKRPTRIGSSRAIADRINGEVTIYINSLPGTVDSSGSDLSASFTFYTLRGDEVKVIDVVHDSLVKSVGRDNDSKWILRYEAQWLKNLAWDDNVYVVPGIGSGTVSSFSKDTAIPVLVRN
jgi:hypothetical protein